MDARSYFTPTGKTLEWITRVHRGLYRWTGGVIGHVVPQRSEGRSRLPVRAMRMLLLTTTGRKSGLSRTVPLPYFRVDGRILVVASFAGGDRHPAWLLNLRDRPTVEIQVGRDRRAAQAVELEGSDRAHCWAALIREWPRYEVYQGQTDRTIPLVELR